MPVPRIRRAAPALRAVKGAWNRDFIDEHVSFPVGRTKDQVDAASAAFNLLTLRRVGLPVLVPIDGLMR